MIAKFIKGKTSVFIDASNVYYSQKRLGWRIDFAKLYQYLKKEIDLVKAFYYTARDTNSVKQSAFISFLEKTGFIVRSKKVKFIKNKRTQENICNGFHKGNLDVELTMDMLETKGEYETILLMSGDSDFEPLIRLMKRKYNKKCLVMATKHNVSIELIRCAKYINLNKLKAQIAANINPR